MKVNTKDNLSLIDKDYEVWGLEEEELLASVIASVAPFVPLSFATTPFVLALAPVAWGGSLVLMKNYKSRYNVRGMLKRKLLVGLERKILKRDTYYV
ncbi:MAG: hypothetical protein GWP10_06740 [Nitrospiraceae bacterium]|nr:hypothetical protein [Nitrospiraceae bacterium]